MRIKSSKKHLFTIIMGAIVAGILLTVISARTLQAESDVTVGVTVVGTPLTVGATILDPVNNQAFAGVTTIAVRGTCAPQAYVVIDSNGSSVGAVICALDGTFALSIQPFPGKNVLTALDYDNLNNPGPATPSVTITYTPPVPPVTVHPHKPITPPPAVSLPSNPSVVPGGGSSLPGLTESDKSCDRYAAPAAAAGGQSRIAIVCVPRLIYPHTKILVGIYLYGGTPPYNLTLSWGDNVQTTFVAGQPGYRVFATMYPNAGSYTLTAKSIDADGNEAFAEVAIHVLGGTTPVVHLKKTAWYQSDIFWEMVIALLLFIFVIWLVVRYMRKVK